MGEAERIPEYRHIGTDPKIAGGAPIIEGTRITVRCIAGYYQLGMSVDEILASLRHLTAAQVHAALAYYFDHQEEVDRDLADAADLDRWKAEARGHGKPSNTST
jgi:uncharacterized protein (DUF433 family)